MEPLRGRPDLIFVRFPDEPLVPLNGYVRLGLGGPELSTADSNCGLLLLDGTWKLAERMEPFLRSPAGALFCLPLRLRIPVFPGCLKIPTSGLATVEALYAALRNSPATGRRSAGLLSLAARVSATQRVVE